MRVVSHAKREEHPFETPTNAVTMSAGVVVRSMQYHKQAQRTSIKAKSCDDHVNANQ